MAEHTDVASLASLASWLNAGLSFIYPEVCQVCKSEKAGPVQHYFCDQCRRKVMVIKPPFCKRCGSPYEGEISVAFECANCRKVELEFESARSAVLANEEVLTVIHGYKYNRAYWFEGLLGEWLATAAARELISSEWDALVPVPLHAVKQREREFNQADRLASYLARVVGIRVEGKWLCRIKATQTQTRLNREERHQNMHRAFAASPSVALKDKRVVLVDDVMTTGATTSACAKALKKAGVARVCVWTVARGT